VSPVLRITLFLVLSLIAFAILMRHFDAVPAEPRDPTGPTYCLVNRQPVAPPMPPGVHCDK
jgi:hypothetical protein